MPYSTEVKARAYRIDPECWVSYSGQPKEYKQMMEIRRNRALQRADDEIRGAALNMTPFFHLMPNIDACDHDFGGWRDFPDGNGGEQFCSKCGMGAMQFTLRMGI